MTGAVTTLSGGRGTGGTGGTRGHGGTGGQYTGTAGTAGSPGTDGNHGSTLNSSPLPGLWPAGWATASTTNAETPFISFTDHNAPAPSPSPTDSGGGGGGGGSSSTESTPQATTSPATQPGSLDPVDTPPVAAVVPGSATVLVDGVEQSVTTVPAGASGTTQVQGDGWSTSVQGLQSSGAPQPAGPGGIVQVPRGAQLRVSGDGYAADSEVQVYALTPPGSQSRMRAAEGQAQDVLSLATLSVGADGAFSSIVPLPASISAGDLVLQANGYAPSMAVRSVSVGIRVLADPKVVNRHRIVTVHFAQGSSRLSSGDRARLAHAVTSLPRNATGVSATCTRYVLLSDNPGYHAKLSLARTGEVLTSLKQDRLPGRRYVNVHRLKADPRLQGRSVTVRIDYRTAG